MNKYEPIIGLEIHVELKTKSKMFCQCSANYFGQKPNTNTCPVCLGLPGALPVPNEQAIRWTMLIGKALNCSINLISKFDRKHYFYPDLPKGYQISQYDEPLCTNGYLEVETETRNSNKSVLMGGSSSTDKVRKFRIRRVHLEEDTGKLLHSGDNTLIDFNRSGVPLVEIVTEADFHNSEDAKAFLEELQTIIRYLDVSDADMEKGSMRCEPNISLRVIPSRQQASEESQNRDPSPSAQDDQLPPYKVEVKNINSFNFAKQAIEYELKRQAEILDKGEIPAQETRGYNENKKITYSQRSKEEAHDYRYFPEPDIPPLHFTQKEVHEIKVSLLPAQKVAEYQKLGLKYADAFTLTRDVPLTKYFDTIVEKSQLDPQKIANLIINKKISLDLSIDKFIEEAKKQLAPKQTDTKLLDETIQKIINANEKVVNDYKSGKQNAIMFLVGQVMKEMKGQANATTVREELAKKLS